MRQRLARRRRAGRGRRARIRHGHRSRRDHDGGAGSGEFDRDSAPDIARSSGDQSHLAGKFLQAGLRGGESRHRSISIAARPRRAARDKSSQPIIHFGRSEQHRGYVGSVKTMLLRVSTRSSNSNN
jgi:hypothetical protein